MTEELREILDNNPTGMAVAEEPDFAGEYGRVEVPGDKGDSSYVRSIQQMLAASTAGIGVQLTPSGVQRSEVVRAAVQTREVSGPGTLIDPTILSMMTMSEFFTLTNGDLWTMACVPIELGFNEEVTLKSKDRGIIKEARELLENMKIRKAIEELWLARFVYGQSYPIFLRERTRGPINGVIAANSKHIAIRPQTGIGQRSVAYAPPADVIEAIGRMSATPTFIHRPVTWQWNEPHGELATSGFEINPEDVMHLHAMKLPNNIYAVPPLIRASTDIEARTDLEEMAQATIRGFRSQLWVFLVDKPRNGEMKALRATLSSEAKTGVLLWGSNLKVEQHVPKSLDDLLGNETYFRHTMAIYRATGATPRIIAGESPNPKGSQQDDTDIAIFLDRTLYSRLPFVDVVQYVVDSHYGDRAPRVGLPDIELKIARRIKEILTPLMNFGVPSVRTAFEKAGLVPEQEMEQHEIDWEWRQKYMHPYTGFSQAGPSGVTNSPQGGRPIGAGDSEPREEKAQASVESSYKDRVDNEWNKLLGSQDADHVEAFVIRILAYAAIYREQAYREGYRRAGGRGAIDMDKVEGQITWDEPNLKRFKQDMMDTIAAGGSLDSYAFRAGLYPQMGYRMAYIAGVFQAKSEQGYTGWQRVLNAAGATESGPCAVCVADSAVVHPIEESFYDHPNGACGMRFIRFFRGDLPTAPIRVPTVSILQDLL
jgi:hypothetical protein